MAWYGSPRSLCGSGQRRTAPLISAPRFPYQSKAAAFIDNSPHPLSERALIAVNRMCRAALGCARLCQLAAVQTQRLLGELIAGEVDRPFMEAGALANIAGLLGVDAQRQFLFFRRQLPATAGVLSTMF